MKTYNSEIIPAIKKWSGSFHVKCQMKDVYTASWPVNVVQAQEVYHVYDKPVLLEHAVSQFKAETKNGSKYIYEVKI